MAEPQKVNINTENLKKQMPQAQAPKQPIQPQQPTPAQQNAEKIVNDILVAWHNLSKKPAELLKTTRTLPRRLTYKTLIWLEKQIRSLREKLEQPLK